MHVAAAHPACEFCRRFGTLIPLRRSTTDEMPILLSAQSEGYQMNGIIYLVGLVVVVLFILSLLGLR